MTALAYARILIAAVAWLAFGVFAGDIYIWIDENGRRQMSDRPPPTGMQGVNRQNSHQSDISPAVQQEALNRAAQERARREQLEAERLPVQAGGAAPPLSVSSSPGRLPSSADICKSKVAAYQASVRCYTPFYISSGGLKPGAFATCGPPVGAGEISRECGTPPPEPKQELLPPVFYRRP